MKYIDPKEKIETFRRLLRDEALVSPMNLLTTQKILPHGHVEAVLMAIRKLGLDSLIASQPCRESDFSAGHDRATFCSIPVPSWPPPASGTTPTLAEELGVGEATEDESYDAMDWLLERQGHVEKKLAARHLGEGSLVLYDVSSSYYEGQHCPLAQYGHDRDGQKGLPIIVYGLMTDGEGRPLAVDVYPTPRNCFQTAGSFPTVPCSTKRVQRWDHLRAVRPRRETTSAAGFHLVH